MHRLGREVRFSINPFAGQTSQGYNSFASKPGGEGLAIYLAMFVELEGQIDTATGFVVNVVEIDSLVRSSVVPVFAEGISIAYGSRRDIRLIDISQMLRASWKRLAGRFGEAKLTSLKLALNPYRKITIYSEDGTMFEFSEKFEFAAMHKLWNDSFTPERNFEVFGKCANPAGHGHNYVLEVTVASESAGTFKAGELEKVVDEGFISAVDHSNLNADVSLFKNVIPTVENIAKVAWDCLNGRFGSAKLTKVSVWETDKTYATYSGSGTD